MAEGESCDQNSSMYVICINLHYVMFMWVFFLMFKGCLKLVFNGLKSQSYICMIVNCMEMHEGAIIIFQV